VEYAPPIEATVAYAPVEERVAYLRRVGLITAFGLAVAAVTAVISMFTIAPLAMSSTLGMGVMFFGSFGIANYVAPRMVFGDLKWPGFLLGTVAEGAAMGMLLLAAMFSATGDLSSGLILIGEALGLTGLAVFGVLAYVWTGPAELNGLKAVLSGLTLPMILLMGITFVFPVGGILGMGLAALFVVMSVGGLVYQGNKVIHQLGSHQHVEGAYMITLGILVLFWNVLVLLMRLNRR
jgi:hypothetical protein